MKRDPSRITVELRVTGGVGRWNTVAFRNHVLDTFLQISLSAHLPWIRYLSLSRKRNIKRTFCVM